MPDDNKKNPIEPIVSFFSKYNLVIFIVVIVTGLTVSIMTLNDILSIPFQKTSNAQVDTTINNNYDTAIIQKLNNLNSSNQNIYNDNPNFEKESIFN